MSAYCDRIAALSPAQKRLLVQQLAAHGVRTAQGEAGSSRLVAYVVTALPPQEVGTLCDFLADQLPSYMLPAAFVAVDTLPLTPSGKVDRKALAARAVDGATVTADNAPFVAPRTPTEAQLAAIWADLLGIERISVQRDFFAAGGHSLLALQLIHRVQQAFQVDLPLAILFQAPTIAELARWVERSPQPAPWTPLVPIRSDGAYPPFFCVHGIGGTVFNLQALGEALPAEQPFYALQAAGLDGQHTPHTTVEAMATAYVAAIRSVQPEGPYFLGGHSFGGEIALAMAWQLQEAGERVALLALLDSYAPGALPAAVVERSNEVFRAYSHQVPGLQAVVQAQVQMHYQPPGLLPVPTVLLRASDAPIGLDVPPSVLFDAALGWNAFITPPVQVAWVPGDHFGMLGEPHVQSLAARLAEQLAVARQRACSTRKE